jgi:hypothetical protein
MEHSIDLSHCILLNNTSILDKKSRCRDRLIVEGMGIDLHPENMNRKDGLSLSGSWRPLPEKEEGLVKGKIVTSS